MNSTGKTVLVWVTLFLVAAGLWKMISTGATTAKDQDVSYSEFMDQVAQNNVSDVYIINDEAHGHFRNKTAFHAIVPANNPEMLRILAANKVDTRFKSSQSSGWLMLLIQLSPFVLLGVLFFVMIRQMQSGG
ncbi:MAG TPA: ATP-dependent metallopeptidase FtsH/Yme1/Tma family protein, partial [Alphaproteobacteria bacterium]|nr:ATP-dependent metallopeptidase FtsH/Yme1/Tma family protein [Alphaproteobacteria bacterium]